VREKERVCERECVCERVCVRERDLEGHEARDEHRGHDARGRHPLRGAEREELPPKVIIIQQLRGNHKSTAANERQSLEIPKVLVYVYFQLHARGRHPLRRAEREELCTKTLVY